jgi:hypothetical protein
MVHFPNKGRRRGRIPWGRSSRGGKGSGMAGHSDRRWRCKMERDEERKRIREEEERPLRPNWYKA